MNGNNNNHDPGDHLNANKLASELNFFKNSIFIKLHNRDQIYTRKDIFVGLYNLKINNLTENVDCISQYNSNNNWVVSFSERFKAMDLNGHEIKIINETSRIDFVDPRLAENCPVNAIYRIQWLPHNFPKKCLEEYFKKFNNKIEILSIFEETCRYENIKMNHIKNGNIRVKIRFPVSEVNKIKVETGMVFLNGFKVILTKIGDSPKCLFCNKFGHFKKDCEKIKLKCEKCNKRGHIKDSCNLANRLTATPDVFLTLNDDNENETNNQSNFINNQNTVEINNTNEIVDNSSADNLRFEEQLSSEIQIITNSENEQNDNSSANNNDEEINTANSDDGNDRNSRALESIINDNKISNSESEGKSLITIDSMVEKINSKNKSDNKKNIKTKKRTLTGSPSDSKNSNKKSNLNSEANDDDTNSKKGASYNQNEDMS